MVYNKLLEILPWRLKGYFGRRPNSTINTWEEIAKTNKVTQVASGGCVQFARPFTFDENLHNTFNENFNYPSPPLYTTEIERGRVFRINYIFSVIDQNNTLLSSLSFDPMGRKTHPVFSEAYLPPAKLLKGKTLMLATLGADTVYFHWMLDLIPRIDVAEKAGHALADFDHILINPLSFQAQYETLKLLNIQFEKLVFVNEQDHYECEQLLVPSLIFHNPSALKYLRRTFMYTCLNFPKERIYITRKNPTWRKILNETQMLELLNKYGFRTVEPEHLSFVEQVALFNSAQVIVSVHGAGLTNLVFGNPGSILIELIADWHKNVDYWICASYAQMRYHYLGCESSPSHAELGFSQTQNYNLTVDIALLEKHLQAAICDI